MKPTTFHVSDSLAGKPLSAAVRQGIDHPADANPLVKSRRVQLNGNVCVDPSRPLRAGDVVKILPHPAALPPGMDDIVLRYIDAHLTVVDKPAGMTTMRYGDEVSASGRRDRLPTLLDLLPRVVSKRLGRSGASGSAPPAGSPRGKTKRGPAAGRRATPLPKLWPVHRLDRDTSGLIVFARAPAVEKELTQLFRDHDFERIYRAVVLGNIAAMTIETNLADDRGDGRRGSVADSSQGKRSVTHVTPLETLGDYTLVECRLETGRTHQIRIHLSEQGHPLCGDRQYRGPLGQKPARDDSGAPRLMLHAASIAFRHPVTGKMISLDSPLPKDFAAFVKTRRRRACEE